jgi:hypothetical protein
VKTKLAVVAGLVVALGAATAALVGTHDIATAAKAFAAGLIAAATGILALSLPGINVRGVVIGAVFVVAGVFTWTFTTRPLVIWLVLLLGGAAFIVWGRPYLPRARDVFKLGTSYLGIAYWVLGVVGAVLVWHPGVAAQRVLYAGVFALAAMTVVATVRRGQDPTVGIAATMLVALALLFLAGSASIFDTLHAVPANASAQLMKDRFWGGPLLWYHPNSMAGFAVAAAVRIGPDRAFALWQRLAVTLVGGFAIFVTDSRIGFVFAVAAALVHGYVLLWRRGSNLPVYRRRWLAVAVPFAVVALVLVVSGGRGFIFKDRFAGSDVTSGRTDTWRQVWVDWKHYGFAEKLFGDAEKSRAPVYRANDLGPDGKPVALNTDNAAVGSFRRGGVLGALAFLAGLVLLAWRALGWRSLGWRGSTPAAWFTVAALAAVPTLATEDWLLGGTNGGLWILLVGGEALLLWQVKTAAEPSLAEEPVIAS